MNEPVQCPKCGSAAVKGDDFCGQCGHKLALLARYRLKQSGERFSTRYAKDVYGGNIKSGRGAILAVTIILAITGIFLITASDRREEDGTAAAIAVFIIAGVFFALWFWAKIQPFPASLTAFILFISLIGINIAFDPTTLAQGFLVKIVILSLLLRAITSSYKYKRLIEEDAAQRIPVKTAPSQEQDPVVSEPADKPPEEPQNE
ncbi:MAG: hypothetical protein HZA48_07100 [Planctomycetes bacterium]|nr:hypothetical protein [Planctomycetota bacterium]